MLALLLIAVAVYLLLCYLGGFYLIARLLLGKRPASLASPRWRVLRSQLAHRFTPRRAPDRPGHANTTPRPALTGSGK